jgi:hypothetical protein
MVILKYNPGLEVLRKITRHLIHDAWCCQRLESYLSD